MSFRERVEAFASAVTEAFGVSKKDFRASFGVSNSAKVIEGGVHAGLGEHRQVGAGPGPHPALDGELAAADLRVGDHQRRRHGVEHAVRPVAHPAAAGDVAVDPLVHGLDVEPALGDLAGDQLQVEVEQHRQHRLGEVEVLQRPVGVGEERPHPVVEGAHHAVRRGLVKAAFEEAQFDSRLADLRGMAEQKIEGDPVKVIDLAAKSLDIRELEKPSILRHLIEGGDLTRYGLFNAVTRTAEDLPDYDRATDFERMGGKLIALPANDWKRISEAA